MTDALGLLALVGFCGWLLRWATRHVSLPDHIDLGELVAENIRRRYRPLPAFRTGNVKLVPVTRGASWAPHEPDRHAPIESVG